MIASPLLTICLADSDYKMLPRMKELEDYDPRELLKLAMSAQVDSTAATAFEDFLVVTRDEHTKPEVISGIRTFAARRGMFYKTAMLVALENQGVGVAQELAKGQDATGRLLASAILACGAKSSYLSKEKWESTIYSEGEDDEDESEELTARKRKLKKKEAAAGEFPVILLQSNNPRTVELAIIAAAYSRNAECAGDINAIQSRDAGVLSARILYAALNKLEITEAMIKSALESISAREKAEAAADRKPQKTQDVESPFLAAMALASFDPAPSPICTFCEAMGIIGGEQNLPVLFSGLRHRDLRVQMDAVRAIRAIRSRAALPELLKIVPSCHWGVLVEVCRAIGEMPDKSAVPVLIARLEKEKGRMRLDLTHALSAIAGDQKGQTAAEWMGWWKTNGPSFEVNAEASAEFIKKVPVQAVVVIPALGHFYGLCIYSDRFSYVIDTSMSMKGPRIDSLKPELKTSVQNLKPIVLYNIVNFGGDISVMSSRLTGRREMGVEKGTAMELTGGTRAFDAIERAFFLEGLDTIYFLTDGAPCAGQINKWSGILRAMTIMNRYRQVAVWCVDFDPAPRNEAYMKNLVAEYWGKIDSVPVMAGFDDGEGERKGKGGGKKKGGGGKKK